MTPPILRVRKDAKVYDDSAQETPLPPRPAPRRRRGAGRGNRPGGRMLVFPLLVVAAGLFIVFRLGPAARADRGTVDGWEVALHVTPEADSLLVDLTFRSRPGQTLSGERASADVTLLGTQSRMILAGDLAKSPMTLSGTLAAAGGKTVQAVVSIGDSHATLRIAIARARSSSP